MARGRWVYVGLVALHNLLSGCQARPTPEEEPAAATRSAGVTVPPEPERVPTPVTVEPSAARLAVVELPEPLPAPSSARQPLPEEEPPLTRLLLTDSAAWERAERAPDEPSWRGPGEEWYREVARAARAGNTSIPAAAALEDIPLANATVEGWVVRVDAQALEVRDEEGNLYELRLDKRSRGLRRGRRVPLRRLGVGMRVYASFDLLGGGESVARVIRFSR